jgi:kynureninase
LIYLDGNSLGVTPKAAPASVQQVVTQEWAVGLIGSWNSAGWMDLAPRIGDKIARLVGAWAAVEHLRQVLECGEWREARFNQRAAVT